MVICPDCRLQNRDDASECVQCRRVLRVAVNVDPEQTLCTKGNQIVECPWCKAQIPEDAKACQHCGKSFVIDQVAVPSGNAINPTFPVLAFIAEK